MKLGFATTNAHKIRETEACLQAIDPNITVVSLVPKQEVEETEPTFEGNARLKLEACLKEGVPDDFDGVFAEDAGLVVEALAGLYGISPFPGVQSNRWFSPQVQKTLLGEVIDKPDYERINQGILTLMENNPNRQARYEAWLEVWSRKTKSVQGFSGSVNLWVANSPSGEGGFGYDPIMIPIEVDPNRTMAQLTLAEKNRISHRHQALCAMVAGFATQVGA